MHISKPVNIIVLCNNEIAIPALQQLYITGVLKAVVVPEKNKELITILQPLLAGSPVSLVVVNKNNLVPTIKTLTIERKVTAALLMTFPYIIPASILQVMPGGFINFHYGILPKYRGSNPILAQMLHGETESGISIHIVDEKIDRGPVIMQQKIAIELNDTFGIQLHKLGILGSSMVNRLLQFYQSDTVPPSVPQDESAAGYFKKVTANDLMINWNTMNSQQVIRMINACNPWNKGAGTIINNQVIRFTEAEITGDDDSGEVPPGTIVSLNEKEGLKVICTDKKLIRVNIIYLPEGFFSGKKLADYGIKEKDIFLSI